MSWLREPDTEPLPGYKLVCPLGTGGFGEVWKCIVPGGIFKAIKFVYGNLNSLDGDSAKAEQEYKALERVKSVRHPFVLSMDRIEVVSGELLIVMELADKSLHDLMEEYQKAGRPGIPRDMLLGFLADAAEGLDHLIEKHNLQHLDVKPKNLFLIADRVKVADFGLVKHLERQSSSGIMGGITPVYASPETFANKISKHSDQYSLAILYCELLTGFRPFSGKNIRQLALQHMTEAPDLSMLPEGDRPAVAKALAKNPEDRFPTCLAFVRALGGAGGRSDVTLGGMSGTETPAPVGRKSGVAPPSRKTKPDFDTATQAPRHGGASSIIGGPSSRVMVPGDKQGPASFVFRHEEGVLHPAILVGIGSFGRRALQQIRCRLLDRIGELAQVPCFRFVYVDAEPEAATKSSAGPADAALQPEHTFHAPLQPVNAYRRRQLDQILEWLPREKLYAIPRSLRVDGARSLGRLAFYDHYLRFVNRFRQEIQVCTHPEALTQSADQTGLPVRSKTPSVYVFVSASGGTSGMTLDVGHAIRRALERFNLTDAVVTAFIFAGAPEDATTPPEELANIFATLTELNHYADPDVKFTAQYGTEGPQVDGHGLPFTATYILPMAQRTPEALRDCLSHLAGYVAHDLTTPLGIGLEKVRKKGAPAGRTPFRSFGTFGVWYPRGLLLRSAARQACVKFLRRWVGPLSGMVPAEAENMLASVLSDVRLTPDNLQEFIAAESTTPQDGNPVERIGQWVTTLNSQADAASRRPDPASWAHGTWDQARDWIGGEPTTESDSPFRRGRLSRFLDVGLKRATEAWQNELAERFHDLETLSGARLAAAEAVIAQLVANCNTAITGLEAMLEGMAARRQAAKDEMPGALQGCQQAAEGGGGFSLFGGGRMTRALKTFCEKLRVFVEIRVREDLATVAARFYVRLGTWFQERQADIATARRRIAELADVLEGPVLIPNPGATPHGSFHAGTENDDEAMHATLRGSNTIRVVLPHGEDHLDRSAAEALSSVQKDELARLEQALTKLVVDPRGGLVGVSKGSSDLVRSLGGPMVEQATAFLSGLLPAEDVTAVELSAAGGQSTELSRRVASYVRGAAPLSAGPVAEERTFVVVPDTEAGNRYAEEVKKAVPGVYVVPVLGAGTDLLFCREQACLRTSDLLQLLDPCFEAYQESVTVVERNPHSRFDVTNWLPLVE